VLERVALPQPKTCDQLFGLSEGTIGHDSFRSRELTRAPFELGCNPSPASIMPALFNCSLNLPISARSSALGILPASEFLLALTITMTVMLTFPCRFHFGSGSRVVYLSL